MKVSLLSQARFFIALRLANFNETSSCQKIQELPIVTEKEAGLSESVVVQENRSPSSPAASEMLAMKLKPSKTFQLAPMMLMAERSKGEMIEPRLKDREGE